MYAWSCVAAVEDETLAAAASAAVALAAIIICGSTEGGFADKAANAIAPAVRGVISWLDGTAFGDAESMVRGTVGGLVACVLRVAAEA